MGLTRSAVAFLAAASCGDVDFERTLTVGRQRHLCTPRMLRAALDEAGLQLGRSEALRLVEQSAGYCEPVLRRLGARVVGSIDRSPYEGATIKHDLNRRLPAEFRARYSAVIDAGSLEHVFNFPVALAGCLESVAVGGHYLAVTPANNAAGHGFYQFSPELYFRVLGKDNGFTVRCMLWRSEHPFGQWYRVIDPAAIARRVERRGTCPAQLYIAAQRTELRDVLAEAPQQSDYARLWAQSVGGITESHPSTVRANVARRIYRRSPLAVQSAWRWIRWGGLPPVLEEARSFAAEARRIRGNHDDFERVALRDLRFA